MAEVELFGRCDERHWPSSDQCSELDQGGGGRSDLQLGARLGEPFGQRRNLAAGIFRTLRPTETFAVDRAKAAIQKARIELARATTLNEARELLEDSAEGLKQMSSLVLNLKGFARVDRDGMDTIDLNDSIRSALTIAGHQLRDRIQVVQELGDVPKVKCMPSQINQVFLNMITNAAQAMDDEGKLTIRSVAKPNVEIGRAHV